MGKCNYKSAMKLPKKIFLIFDILFAVSLFSTAIFLLLLTRKPMDFVSYENDSNTVSPYLTHILAPQFWDNLQIGEPFSLKIEQNGLNDIISRDSFVSGGWPILYDKVKVFAPVIIFKQGSLAVIAKTELLGVAMYFTVDGQAQIDADGACRVIINQIKVGNVDMTAVGMAFARKMLSEYTADEIETLSADEKKIYNIIHGLGFEPVFSFSNTKVRVSAIDLQPETAIIEFQKQN